MSSKAKIRHEDLEFILSCIEEHRGSEWCRDCEYRRFCDSISLFVSRIVSRLKGGG